MYADFFSWSNLGIHPSLVENHKCFHLLKHPEKIVKDIPDPDKQEVSQTSKKSYLKVVNQNPPLDNL